MASRETGHKTKVVAFEGPMTIERAEGIRDQLFAALGGKTRVGIDLSGVTEADLTGLQLICAVCKSSVVSNSNIVVTGLSDPVQAAAKAGGFGFAECVGLSCLLACGG